MRAQRVANSKFRRLLAYGEFFNCADISVWGSALFYKTQNRRSLPRRRGPARIPDIDETGATVTLRSPTFKVARYCARNRMHRKDVHEEVTFPCLHFFDSGPIFADSLHIYFQSFLSFSQNFQPRLHILLTSKTSSCSIPINLMVLGSWYTLL